VLLASPRRAAADTIAGDLAVTGSAAIGTTVQPDARLRVAGGWLRVDDTTWIGSPSASRDIPALGAFATPAIAGDVLAATFRASGTYNGTGDTGLYVIVNKDSSPAKVILRAGGVTAATALVLRPADTDAMTLLSDGRVGIGTAVAGRRLEVADTAAAVLRLTAASGGGVGIDNPANSAFLELFGTVQPGSNNNGEPKYRIGMYGVDAINTSLYVYDSRTAAVRLVVTQAGSLGVGTTSPGAKLDVAGDVRAATAVKVGDRTIADAGGSFYAP
jgi:hypothetical protein